MKESIKKKFDSIDKSKIKVESTKELLAKIEKALNGKIEENADKAEALLDKFIAQAKAKNADIFVSKKAEPTLTPTEKKKATQVVKSKLETLMDTIANDPLLKDFNNSRRSKGGGKSDPLIDSERKAIQSGPRVSKKGWKNQYGKSDGGRKYYEYRENRIDRKAPNYGSRPWLKEGGFIHPSDANADKYVVVEIKADGSRREHNNFGDLETARMFASLKREFLPKGSQLMIEDKNGKNLYRSFKSGGMMSEQDYEKGFENEKTHLDSEDFAKISARVDEEYLAKDRKSGVHDKFTKYWYSGGREKAIAKYGEDESNAWEESYEDFKEDFYKMAKGGRVDESTAMVLSQNKAIAHHTEELKKAIAKNKKVEPWVVAKIERASTDISDVTHYLDGKTEYAKGGKIENQYEGRSDSDIWNSWTKEQKYHFLDDHNDEFPQIGRNEKKILQNVEYNNILNADIEDSLKRHIRQGEYANGGEIEGVDLFEDYEDQPQEVKSILANYEMEDNDYETLQNLKAELESIGYTMDFGLDAEPYDLRKIGEKGKSEFYAKGGKIKTKPIINQYEGRLYDDIWNNWTENQRYNFIEAYKLQIEKRVDYKRDIYSNEFPKRLTNQFITTAYGSNWKDLDESVKNIFMRHVNKGQFAQGGMMADGGKVRWQDVYVGDNALVIAENKMGMVVKPYGRRFHLKFPDGSEKTYSAEELEFFKDEEYAKGGQVGDFFYDSRKDKAFQVIFEDGNKMGLQYLGMDKKPIGEIVKIDKNDFEYNVEKGSWGKWKQDFAKGGELAHTIKKGEIKIGDKIYKAWFKDESTDSSFRKVFIKADNKEEATRKAKVLDEKHFVQLSGNYVDVWGKYVIDDLKDDGAKIYARGGKTPIGDYVKRKDIKLIYVKNPNKNGSNKFLKIDKSDFLDGLHKMSEGGKLTDEYTYIKRSDVTDVVYRDDQTSFASDRKPQNGFWVSKKALVDAGMNATEKPTTKLDFGTTSLRKGENGWKAKNSVDNYKGYDWEITTMKTMRGELVSTAVGGKNEKGGSGYTMFTYVMYQDPNIRLMTSKPSRITDKAVAEQHKKALELFESKVGEKYAKGGEIQVAVGDKVKSKSGVDGIVYESMGTMFKLQDKYGNKSPKYHSSKDFKPSEITKGEKFAKGGSISNGSKLPEEMGRYFTKPRGTKVISMSSIIPLRARAEGIANAEKNMKMAYDGKMEKRKPITLYKSQGKYRVYDGNSTYAVAKANGWENIWAEVIKNPNMNTYDKRGNDIFTKAKAIRKEGEAWKDALQRAKAMK